jgi:hypothetical protein
MINYGELRELEVRKGEPVFGSAAVVLADVRLDSDEKTRPEATLVDFNLCQEFRRMVRHLDEIEDGHINRIEVRAGLPRRMLFEAEVGRLLR